MQPWLQAITMRSENKLHGITLDSSEQQENTHASPYTLKRPLKKTAAQAYRSENRKSLFFSSTCSIQLKYSPVSLSFLILLWVSWRGGRISRSLTFILWWSRYGNRWGRIREHSAPRPGSEPCNSVGGAGNLSRCLATTDTEQTHAKDWIQWISHVLWSLALFLIYLWKEEKSLSGC